MTDVEKIKKLREALALAAGALSAVVAHLANGEGYQHVANIAFNTLNETAKVSDQER